VECHRHIRASAGELLGHSLTNARVRSGDQCNFVLQLRHAPLQHEVQNLYVTDASFFPSMGAVNPTLTIIASALRVAETISMRI
jgi:hypothetical protein